MSGEPSTIGNNRIRDTRYLNQYSRQEAVFERFFFALGPKILFEQHRSTAPYRAHFSHVRFASNRSRIAVAQRTSKGANRVHFASQKAASFFADQQGACPIIAVRKRSPVTPAPRAASWPLSDRGYRSLRRTSHSPERADSNLHTIVPWQRRASCSLINCARSVQNSSLHCFCSCPHFDVVLRKLVSEQQGCS